LASPSEKSIHLLTVTFPVGNAQQVVAVYHFMSRDSFYGGRLLPVTKRNIIVIGTSAGGVELCVS
jgi:hypothetical protein